MPDCVGCFSLGFQLSHIFGGDLGFGFRGVGCWDQWQCANLAAFGFWRDVGILDLFGLIWRREWVVGVMVMVEYELGSGNVLVGVLSALAMLMHVPGA